MIASESRPTPRRHALLLATALATVLGLGACSTTGSSDAAPSTTAARSTTTADPERSTTTSPSDPSDTTDPGDDTDPDLAWCPSVAAIGAVVGGEVTRRPSQGVSFSDDVSYRSDGCTYELAGDKGSVDVLRMTADGSPQADLFGTLETAAAKKSDEHGFEHLPDLGDDAYRDGQSLAVRSGDQIFLFSYSPTGGFDDEDPDKALRVADAVLALDVSTDRPDCDAIGEALEDEFGPVDHTLSGGGVDGVDDVTLETTNCTVAFTDEGEATVAVAPDDLWDRWIEAKEGSGFLAVFDETSIGELAAFDDGESLFVDDGERPLRVTTDDLKVSAAAAAKIRVEVAELAVGS